MKEKEIEGVVLKFCRGERKILGGEREKKKEKKRNGHQRQTKGASGTHAHHCVKAARYSKCCLRRWRGVW